MKRALSVLRVAVALAVTWSVGFVQGQEKQPKKKDLVFVSADKAEFKEVVPGVSKAVLWSDHDKGPYVRCIHDYPRTAGLESGVFLRRRLSPLDKGYEFWAFTDLLGTAEDVRS